MNDLGNTLCLIVINDLVIIVLLMIIQWCNIKNLGKLTSRVKTVDSTFYTQKQTFLKVLDRIDKATENDKNTEEKLETIDYSDTRYKKLISDFPMFGCNYKVCIPDNANMKNCLLVYTDEGSILRYKWADRALYMYKSSKGFDVLHAVTTFEQRNAQLFATFELLCDVKMFKGVYATGEDTPNELEVVMRDNTKIRYDFNRAYTSNGMVIKCISN